MNQITSGLKLAGAVFTAGLYGFKVLADVHRHQGHQAHNQLCDCLGWCTACIYVEAFNKGKAKAQAKT